MSTKARQVVLVIAALSVGLSLAVALLGGGDEIDTVVTTKKAAVEKSKSKPANLQPLRQAIAKASTEEQKQELLEDMADRSKTKAQALTEAKEALEQAESELSLSHDEKEKERLSRRVKLIERTISDLEGNQAK
jgi:FixJ family two-component response regulator